LGVGKGKKIKKKKLATGKKKNDSWKGRPTRELGTDGGTVRRECVVGLDWLVPEWEVNDQPHV